MLYENRTTLCTETNAHHSPIALTYSTALLNDILDWDVYNWSQVLSFWEKHSAVNQGSLTCLELGARKGGISLWLALNKNKVLCTDLKSPKVLAKELHESHRCASLITYDSLNASTFNEGPRYDIVVFKSVLGSVSNQGRDELKKQTIDAIYQSLKPGGKLLFAENLEASFLHRTFRNVFTPWGKNWNYLTYGEIAAVFSSFDQIEFKTSGFLGAFGRTETQREFLGKMDKPFLPLVPKTSRYIVYGVATKASV